MDDFSFKAAFSPIIWCCRCKKLVAVGSYIAIMGTICRATPNGIYPWGMSPESMPQLWF